MLDCTDKGWVSTQEIAEQFGTDNSNTRRWLIRAAKELGIERITARGARGAQVKAWAPEDAARLMEHRRRKGFMVGQAAPVAADADMVTAGCVYIVRVDPILPRRVKAGYTTNIEQRLASYRTIAPRLALLATWECPAWAERASLAAIEATDGAQRVGEEVFDADPEAAIERVGRLMALMGLAG